MLVELGYDKMETTDNYILCPRNESQLTIINTLNKSFTFYKNKPGIQKDISLKHLCKT